MTAKHAIVGLGVTPQGKLPGISLRSLRRMAVELALADAGLPRRALEGYVFATGREMNEDLRYMGLSPKFAVGMQSGGATAILTLISALGALDYGLASHVVCVGGNNFASSNANVGAFSYGYPQLYGMIGPASSHALHARRHMHQYGTTSRQLGAVAVMLRDYALNRPEAIGYGKPITLEDHQASRMIVDPFHLLDCCRDTDGAVAVIVTTAERARDLKPDPVYIRGVGLGHNVRNWHLGTAFDNHDDIAPAKENAFRMAGLALEDVNVAQLYDPFTISVIMQLEAYGFCGPGEGGPFVEGGQTRPGGRIPTNTAGGQISGWYAPGFTPMTEAVRQLRGQAEAGQLPDVEVALVSGHGGNAGVQNTWAHATALLSTRP
jgi:acetyl-CoA acetyltransferase